MRTFAATRHNVGPPVDDTVEARHDRGVRRAQSQRPGPAVLEHRFGGDLAVWWPLISPPAEYVEAAAYAAALLRSAAVPVQDVLELGSGGGNNAVHLKASFVTTLTDLSEEMLDVSRRLNPECHHHQGDMRTLRLGRTFDAAFGCQQATREQQSCLHWMFLDYLPIGK